MFTRLVRRRSFTSPAWQTKICRVGSFRTELRSYLIFFDKTVTLSKATLRPVALIMNRARLILDPLNLRFLHLGPSSFAASNTGPPTVLGGVEVIDEQLAVLAVSVGCDFRSGDVDNVKGICCLGDIVLAFGGSSNSVLDDGATYLVEDLIHLLERSVGGLWVEEVDAGDDESIEDGEDDICLVANGCKGHRRDHDDHEVKDPVCGRGQGICGRADSKWHDFGGIQPRKHAVSDAV